MSRVSGVLTEARRKGTVRGRFFTGVAIECLIVGVESNSALWDIIWRQ